MRMSLKRIDVRAILKVPAKRRRLLVGVIRATQAREGIDTTVAQAQAAYDAVYASKHPAPVNAPRKMNK